MKHKKWLTVLFIHGNKRRYQVSIWAEGNGWVIEKVRIKERNSRNCRVPTKVIFICLGGYLK